MKVIRKNSLCNANQPTISAQDIVAVDTGRSIILTEAVKSTITITYDELGYADIQKVNLGVQYDHRVTWLHFNLDKLIWHLNEERGYTQDTKYNYYVFKLGFTRIVNSKPQETSMWQFDGVDFEIPRGITKNPGLYRIVLMIEEEQSDPHPGNIHQDTFEHIERFVTKDIKGKVEPTFYSPMYEIDDTIRETDQNASLRKPSILCTLDDNGLFAPDTLELGQQFDNAIRYFKFNPRRITAHLNDFYLFAIFKQKDKFFYSMFEQTVADDPLDDYSVSYPMIGWIPSGVYQTSGTWEVAIIAFTGDLQDINNPEEGNGDYYFYVSDSVKMKVIKNFLTIEEVEKEPILSVTTNLIDGNGAMIMTEDGEIFQEKRVTDGN